MLQVLRKQHQPILIAVVVYFKNSNPLSTDRGFYYIFTFVVVIDKYVARNAVNVICEYSFLLLPLLCIMTHHFVFTQRKKDTFCLGCLVALASACWSTCTHTVRIGLDGWLVGWLVNRTLFDEHGCWGIVSNTSCSSSPPSRRSKEAREETN